LSFFALAQRLIQRSHIRLFEKFFLGDFLVFGFRELQKNWWRNMLKKRSITTVCTVILIIFLGGCAQQASPAAPVSEEQSMEIEAPQYTATSTPTEVPTFTPTLEPTPTTESTATPEPTVAATPLPEPISVDNAGRLVLAASIDLERKFLAHHRSNWGIGRWSPDGNQIVVETDLGIDILEGNSLDLIAEYAGLVPIDFLSDGQLAVLNSDNLDFVAPASGIGETVFTFDVIPSALAVSPDGGTLVYVVGPRSYMKVDLSSGEQEEIEILRNLNFIELTELTYSFDNLWLYVTGKLALIRDRTTVNVAETVVVNIETDEISYALRSFDPPRVSPHNGFYTYLEGFGANRILVAAPQVDGVGEFVQTAVSGKFFEQTNQQKTDTCWADEAGIEAFTYDINQDASKIAVMYLGYTSVCPKPNTITPRGEMVLYDTDDPTNNEIVWQSLGINPLQMRISPADTSFFTISTDDVIRLWSLTTGDLLAELAYALDSNLRLNADASQLLAPAQDGLKLITLDTQKVVQTVPYPEYPSRGGRDLAWLDQVQIIGNTDELFLLDFRYVGTPQNGWGDTFVKHTYALATDGRVQRHFVGAGDCSTSANYATLRCSGFIRTEPQYEFVAKTKLVWLFDVETGELLTGFDKDSASFIALDPVGENYFSCRAGTNAFNVSSIRENLISQYVFLCQDAVFLPDGATILLANGTLVDRETKEVRGSLAFGNPVTEFGNVLVSSDHNLILIANMIFDLRNGALLIELPTAGDVIDAVFSADGLTLTTLTQHMVAEWQVRP
jgi:hypothetical protein